MGDLVAIDLPPERVRHWGMMAAVAALVILGTTTGILSYQIATALPSPTWATFSISGIVDTSNVTFPAGLVEEVAPLSVTVEPGPPKGGFSVIYGYTELTENVTGMQTAGQLRTDQDFRVWILVGASTFKLGEFSFPILHPWTSYQYNDFTFKAWLAPNGWQIQSPYAPTPVT